MDTFHAVQSALEAEGVEFLNTEGRLGLLVPEAKVPARKGRPAKNVQREAPTDK